MKGDFSRQTHDPKKHYSGVLMQQGRVQTDADWNEQEAIARRRMQLEALDVIGACGAPEGDAGFGITFDGPALAIGAGRYYVDGILAENDVDGRHYEFQPDLPAPPDWADALAKAKTSFGLVYLDVWERHVTALDDPLLREVALGAPDTATRVKTLWQVRVLPVIAKSTPAQLKQLQAQREQLKKDLFILYDSGGTLAKILATEKKLKGVEAEIAAFGKQVRCDSPFGEWDDLVGKAVGTLNVRTQPPAAPKGPCVVPATAGYRRLENQLYRIEVHKPGAPGTATFKWSRDNGTVVTSIEKISGKDITVGDLGPDDVLGFASGQWVEIGDDALELAGARGQLAQIDTVNTSLRRITLKSAPTPLAAGADGVDAARHPKVRRWDQSGTTATADGVVITGAWLPLEEDGIEVQFSIDTFRTGEYWVVPARAATGEVEWPPFEIPNKDPEPQLARGIEHHYCRLALIEPLPDSDDWWVAGDCRDLFPPLTALCCENGSLHVVETNWRNDDRVSAVVITKDGLRIRLDGPPEPGSLTNDTVQVAIEGAYPQGERTTPNVLHRLYLRGLVTRDPDDDHVIVWRPRPEEGSDRVAPAGRRRATRAATPKPRDFVAEVTAGFTTVEIDELRVRVTLKGSCIWNDPDLAHGKRVFLDGVAFGQPGTRERDNTPRIDLAFPSGHGGAASDFESWFYFGAERGPVPPFRADSVNFLNASDASSSAGEVALPVGDLVISFKAGEAIRFIDIHCNRTVKEDSLGNVDRPAVFVESLAAGAGPLAGEARLVDANVIRYELRDPSVFPRGRFQLVVAGGPDAAGGGSGLLAANDGSALDGDFDGTPGGDLKLPFTAL